MIVSHTVNAFKSDITDIEFQLIPPKYTKLKPSILKGNSTQITSITGSILRCKIKSDQHLNSAIIINNELKAKFKINKPKILITGLNPHAGEDGLLGKEDEKIIMPLVRELKNKNIKIDGPVPADTAFLKKNIKAYDIILTMYHDQGLPVIKFHDFKKTVNVTLGLPITRVSVDHGTALDLVGTGNIDISSFVEAIKVAKRIYNGYT